MALEDYGCELCDFSLHQKHQTFFRRHLAWPQLSPASSLSVVDKTLQLPSFSSTLKKYSANEPSLPLLCFFFFAESPSRCHVTCFFLACRLCCWVHPELHEGSRVNKHLCGYLHLLDWSQREPAPTLVPSPSLSEASRRAIFNPAVKFWLWEKQPKTWHLQGHSKQTQPRTKLGRYLSMKEGCLFVCTYEIHWTGMLQIMFLASLESSWRGGVHRLGPGSWYQRS
jgi:hypothetical protein